MASGTQRVGDRPRPSGAGRARSRGSRRRSCRTPVGRPVASRRITPPAGIGAALVDAGLDERRGAGERARGGRGPRARPAGPGRRARGRRRSASGRAASGSQPAALDPARRRPAPRRGRRADPARRARRSTRSPRASTRDRASAASARCRWASVRPGIATSSRREVQAARARDRPGLRRRPRRPAATTRPPRTAIASTHPGPSAPASVAILPTTTRSALAVIPRPRVPLARRPPAAAATRSVPVGGIGGGRALLVVGRQPGRASRACSIPAVDRDGDRDRAAGGRHRAVHVRARSPGIGPRRTIDRSPHRVTMQPTAISTVVVPTKSDSGPTMRIGSEARHRHQHVEDAEHAAADVLGQVLLELGLRRDRDEGIGHAGEQRDEHDDREQRREVGHRAEPGGRLGALQESRDRGRDREQHDHDARARRGRPR